MSDKKEPAAAPGDGLRSVRTTTLFKAVNFELYVKPNLVIMGLGITAFCGCLAYITYMRNKYESQGYYSAVQEDGKEEFVKRKSKWDD
ncbi:hypothetical protein Zmor_013347 [Zophobas morio]|uniref:Small integral membrane protein 8 n=1 Tax=Zophobas morio TaxID=2755281 RepID=A0AA38IFA6_9CUCU|nr:hypothetical protein Zmor_013347 [Zophobas morio]